MIIRLPKWAELAFASQCAAAGALAHPPEEDQNGWDYLVEFPQEAYSGPADTHPPAKSAYVQIKSVRKRRLTCRVTLSNALKAVQSTQPWFLVLAGVDKQTSKTEIYAAHLWEDFMRRVLKAVRVAENAGKPLNRSTLSIKFLTSDRHDEDLVSWMQGTIAQHDADYQQKKQKLYKTVGFEDGVGVGNFTISASNFDEIANNFLGLGDGLSLSEFSFTPSRFGVLSPQPEIDYSGEGKIVITPSPVDACEVRIRASDVWYSIKGQVFSLGAPIVPREEMRIRFSADFFDMVVTGDLSPQVMTFNVRMEPDSQRTLYSLEALAALTEWCQTETQVDLQVWARGHRVISGTMALRNPPFGSVRWGRLAAAMRTLRAISVGSEVKVSLREVLKGGKRLAVFTETLSASSFSLEFEPTEETPTEIHSLIFYSFVEVGSFLFFVLLETELIKEASIGVRRQLDFGVPRTVDSYLIESPTPKQREQMEKDYLSYLEGCGKQRHAIGIGEILTFSQSTDGRLDAA